VNRALLGEVEFSVVESENPSDTAEITENPVEKGQDIADHVKIKPFSMPISGVVVGEDAAQKLQKLLGYFRTGQLLTYVGRNVVASLIIEQFDRAHDSTVANGFAFSMKLKQVKIATAKEVIIADPAVNTQAKPSTNKGVQQPKQKSIDDQKRLLVNKKLEAYDALIASGGGGGGGTGAF
jgi:hypothetical protein